MGHISPTLAIAQFIISEGNTTGPAGPRQFGGNSPTARAVGSPTAGITGMGGINGDPAGKAGVIP